MADERGHGKNVYLTLHENFVREGIAYTDRATGERKTFNQVRLPAGTVIDGRDVGGYEFSPLFVDASRFKGPEGATSRFWRTARCGSGGRCSTRRAVPSPTLTASA